MYTLDLNPLDMGDMTVMSWKDLGNFYSMDGLVIYEVPNITKFIYQSKFLWLGYPSGITRGKGWLGPLPPNIPLETLYSFQHARQDRSETRELWMYLG